MAGLIFPAGLPEDIDHNIQVLLRITEVFKLRRVCRTAHQSITQEFDVYSWDLIHIADVDPSAHRWLNYILKANVRFRYISIEKPVNALVSACYNGWLSVVKVLVKLLAPGQVNRADAEGWTPLYAAIMASSFDVVRFLLSLEDVNVNTRAGSGRVTALHVAAYNGRMKYIELLTSVRGVDFNARNRDGETPLHMAAKSGSIETVRYFLSLDGVNINVRNTKNGDTPLHLAVESGDVRIVNLFIEHEYNLGITNYEGIRALDLYADY